VEEEGHPKTVPNQVSPANHIGPTLLSAPIPRDCPHAKRRSDSQVGERDAESSPS
jgi:hypothetical protein